MDQPTSNSQSSFSDLKIYYLKVKKHWYLFVISLIIAFTIAFFQIRYAPEVYPVEVAIVIKGGKQAGGSAAELLYGAQQFENMGSPVTESLVLSSYPVIKETVASLNFQTAFFTEGNINTSEDYLDAPATVEIDTSSTNMPTGKEMEFIVIDENKFTLYFTDSDGNENVKKEAFLFNMPVEYQGFKFRMRKRPEMDYRKISGKKYIFRVFNLHSLTNSYRRKIRVIPGERDPYLLTISTSGTIPQKEIDFLTKLIEIYTREELRKKNENATNIINFIDKELNNITDSLNFIESKLELFKTERGVTDISEDSRRLFEQLNQLETERAAMNSEINYYDYIVDIVYNNDDVDDLVVPSASGISDPVLNGLIATFVELQKRKRTMQRNAPKNPNIQQLNIEIEAMKSNIIESVNNIKRSVQFSKSQIEQRIQKLNQGLRTLPGAQRELVDITRLNELSESLYLLFTQKRAEAGISKASTTSDVQIINPPMQTGGPISPNSRQIYMIAFFLGISIPMAFIFVRGYFNNKINFKEDIEKNTKMPFLGTIYKRKKGGNLVIKENPKSAVSESFRSVRSNLQFFTSNKEKKVFVLTSAISGEGKTFCAINLSIVFSLSGKNTLLIGADLRRPKIFEDFDLKNKIGLSNYLAHSATKADIIQQTSIPNLHVISAGPIPPNPSELLMGSRMSTLLVELKEDYETIIIDTAPIGLVSDAITLTDHADHFIYVVRQGVTTHESLRQAQDLFASGKFANASILFNDVNLKKSSKKYGYYEDE